MLADFIQIPIAAALCWILFVAVDIVFRLPEKGGVKGATAIGRKIEEDGGALAGGTMMGNIVSSPDASAGTLLAACGVYVAGLPGGLAAAVLVFIGNRICHDPGSAGTTGAVLASVMISGFVVLGFAPENFIAGMVIAILTIQGLSHPHASRLLARIWGWRH